MINTSERIAVSVAEAARRLSVCDKSVKNYIRAGELRSAKLGRRRLVPVVELEAFLLRKMNPRGEL